MTEKMLGKIQAAKFGYGGYQDSEFGVALTFGSDKDAWGVGTFIGGWGLSVACSKHAKWTETDRDASFAKTMRRINEIMDDAKVSDFTKLVGVPVEVEFDGTVLKDWRVLTEVR